MHDKSLRVIFFVFMISFISDVGGLFSMYIEKENIVFYNVCLLLEATFLYFFFFQSLNSKVVKKTVLATAVAFILIWFFYFFETKSSKYLNVCNTIENITIIIFSLIFYYERIIKANTLFFAEKPLFWIVSAYFIYCAGTFFLFLYLASLSMQDQLRYYTVINCVFTLLRTTLLCIGLLINSTKKTDKRPEMQKGFY
jgi:hypothetical protein